MLRNKHVEFASIESTLLQKLELARVPGVRKCEKLPQTLSSLKKSWLLYNSARQIWSRSFILLKTSPQGRCGAP